MLDIEKKNHILFNEQYQKKAINSDPKETFNKKSVLIVGDSMLNGVEENRICGKNFDASIKYFSGAKKCDIADKTDEIVKKKPDCVILHVGTNNAPDMASNEILDELLSLKHRLEKECPSTKVIISSLTTRTDNGKAALTIRNFNTHLRQLDVEIVDNKNITAGDLGKKGLHFSKAGKIKFAKNLKSKLEKLY